MPTVYAVSRRLSRRLALLLDRLTKGPHMSLPPYAVDFRGHPACPCQVKWFPVFEAEAQRRGILNGTLSISQLIGGYSGSGGTHADGGAGDLYPLSNVRQVDGAGGLVWLARQMGADATWHRRYNWDGAGGVEHIHSVLRGCPHNSPARYQIVAVDQGFNGLGHLGQSAADDGPRPLSGRTWREGIAWAKALQEEDMKPEDFDQIRQIVREEVDAVLDAPVNIHDPKGEGAFRGKTIRGLLKDIWRHTAGGKA